MRSSGASLVLAVALTVLVPSGVGRADEEKVALDKLPRPVVEAVKKRFPDAELKSAEKEEDNGKTVYEVAVTSEGRKSEVTLTPDGALVEIENQLAVTDLPKAVSQALGQMYAKANLKTIEAVVKVRDGKEKL